ncbi:hypothetical protein [Sphingomonas nostoxanthinifaciens]|uniref:hypothetical protein n=1 Tax=Sphingomonas nostoxanthinifaciens TaxID=2872652 RepID=UPI001CC20346|nr:hypothetical protein [Sphingomonas nostoxanthinifaciens]UAK26387.1 hypothetical protein K8P63_10030 [Sphingomonas nostoxanthinifaciens]
MKPAEDAGVIPLRLIFRSRWAALFWAGGICWTAVSFAGGGDRGTLDAATSATSNQAQASALLAEDED